MDALFEARQRALSEPVDGLQAALMYSSGWFLLWLEGADDAVDTVLKRSSKRLRQHVEPRIIHRSRGAATLAEPLTLLSTQWPETPGEFALRIDAVEGAGPLLEPADIWRRLAQPCPLGMSEPARRVALVGADDMRSIELVRQLADRFRVPMVYQRYANSDAGTPDVGAAYADLPMQGAPTRVHVLSRRALAHRMVRQCLRDVHDLTVLLGPRPATAIELADSVAGLVHSAPQAPSIHVVGESLETARSVTDYLSRKLQHAIRSRLRATGTAESRLLEVLFGPGAQPA
jgi:hypothetical protein